MNTRDVSAKSATPVLEGQAARAFEDAVREREYGRLAEALEAFLERNPSISRLFEERAGLKTFTLADKNGAPVRFVEKGSDGKKGDPQTIYGAGSTAREAFRDFLSNVPLSFIRAPG